MNIGIIGLGKLGLPLAVLFSKHFQVYGVDISEKRVKQIINHERFNEPQMNEYLEKYGKNIIVSTSYDIIKNCDAVFIITQTPSLKSGKFDLQYVEFALKELHEVNPSGLAVISSTINIGDTDKLETFHKKVCYNPEFIKQGSIIHDFENPKFVLIGAYTRENGEQVANIWRKIHDKPTYIVQPGEAEIIKLSLNVSFTLGITFANMIGELCEKFTADSDKVLDVIYQDRRNYKSGLGYMGPCFPRDVNCFKATCIKNHVGSGYKFAKLLNNLNDHVVDRFIRKIKSFGKKRVGILGVAYKPNVPYVYKSQPLKIAERLIEENHEVYIYDPLAEENAKKVLNSKAHFCSTIDECVDEAEIIFIGTVNYSGVKTDKATVNPWR
jgi:UDPglucose 6-dehydrogenase